MRARCAKTVTPSRYRRRTGRFLCLCLGTRPGPLLLANQSIGVNLYCKLLPHYRLLEMLRLAIRSDGEDLSTHCWTFLVPHIPPTSAYEARWLSVLSLFHLDVRTVR